MASWRLCCARGLQILRQVYSKRLPKSDFAPSALAVLCPYVWKILWLLLQEQSFDQKFESSNKALLISCQKGLPLRVVRSHKVSQLCISATSHACRHPWPATHKPLLPGCLHRCVITPFQAQATSDCLPPWMFCQSLIQLAEGTCAAFADSCIPWSLWSSHILPFNLPC